jgi:alkanesulfonate monooxygenase SsuD/methylene tetrahydromethanopterin reductase-like flavin-dependent oxidoreductase (luciferase family)
VWAGGASDRVLGVAARSAEAWNGWGLDAVGFAARAARLAELAAQAGRDPAEVPPTWGGIVLVGEDRPALDALEADRAAKGLQMSIWRGTTQDLRRARDALRAAGAVWWIATAAGPADRLELIAETMHGG